MKQLKFPTVVVALCLSLLAGQSAAQTVSGEILVEALRAGGFVIVMRHADSPRQVPDAATANPDNVNRERQLDAKGRSDATAMGEALRRLRIPIVEVGSSPTYRALETAGLAGFTEVTVHEQLGNEGMRDAGEEYTAWLREQVALLPENGNRLLITHAPNVNAAFPDYAGGMEEGEALVIDPRGMDGPVLAGRVKIGEWPQLLENAE